MLKTESRRGRYMLAAVLGFAAGGIGVKIAPRVLPKIMAAMCGKMHSMMSEMTGAGEGVGDWCQRMMRDMGQGTQASAFEQCESPQPSLEYAGCRMAGCDCSPLV